MYFPPQGGYRYPQQQPLVRQPFPQAPAPSRAPAPFQQKTLETTKEVLKKEPYTAPPLKEAEYVQKEEADYSKVIPIRQKLVSLNEQLDKGGKKYSNLIRMDELAKGIGFSEIEVPVPQVAFTDKVEAFLKKNNIGIDKDWKALKKLYDEHGGEGKFLDRPDAQQHLQNIRDNIAKAFAIVKNDPGGKELEALFGKELVPWLANENSKGHFLMVRSTGTEDTKKTANAGGNISPHYIRPEKEALCDASRDVICSYFKDNSLRNLINANPEENPFENPPKLSVLTQHLIGEEPISAAQIDAASKKGLKDIPVSMVLFSTEPLYVGNECFRAMRISASYGHGEGVVGGAGVGTDTVLVLVSEKDPEKLYVLYDNADKPKRLAPVATQDGVALRLVDNPGELRKEPVLNSNMLTQLFKWGVLGENFFQDPATDMEIVIKGGKIYPVQARPVIRKEVTDPQYLDMKKVKSAESSPVAETLRSEMLVPGESKVVTTSPDRICFAASLEEAEKMYDKKMHDAVIVTRPEPANSHPVVNFSSLGVPCLYVKKQDVLEKIMGQADQNHPLVICTQEGTLNLWDNAKGSVNDFTSKGYTSHPAKIAISLPVQISQTTWGRSAEVSEKVESMLMDLRCSATNEAALKTLNELRETEMKSLVQQRDDLLAKMKSHTFVPKQVGETLTVLNQLIQKVDTAFKETQAAFEKPTVEQPLRQLFHVKVLQTLLVGEPSKEGAVGQYSKISMKPYLDDAVELLEYQAKVPSHPVRFGEIYLAGDAAIDPASKQVWRDFLIGLETNPAVTTEQINRIHEMVRTLQASGTLSTWFAFYFKKGASLQQVLDTFPQKDDGKIKEALSLASEIKAFRGDLEAFSKPETFAGAQKHLETLMKKITDETSACNTGKLLNGASPVTSFVILNILGEAVDLYDTAIKQMKGFHAKTEDEKKVQTANFKKMLIPYFSLLDSSVKSMNLAATMKASSKGTITNYMDNLKKAFTEHTSLDIKQLEPTKDFSVAAATYSPTSNYERQRPKTLDDYFTVFHQNLISAISHSKDQLLNDDIIKNSAIPLEAKKIIQDVSAAKLFNKWMKTGVEVTDKDVTVKYNIPLMNHSAQVATKYDKESKETTLQVKFLGVTEGIHQERWSAFGAYANLLNSAGVMTLVPPVKITSQELGFTWKIDNNLPLAFAEIDQMCNATISKDQFGEKTNSDVGSVLFERGFATIQLAEGGRKQKIIEGLIKQIRTGKPATVYSHIEAARIALKNSKFDPAVENQLIEAVLPWALQGVEDVQSPLAKRSLKLLSDLADSGNALAQKRFNEVLDKLATKCEESLLLIDSGDAMRANRAKVDAIIKLFKDELLPNKRGVEQAVRFGLAAMNTKYAAEKALGLFNEMVNKGIEIEKATDAAEIAFEKGDALVRYKALNLFITLVQKFPEVSSEEAREAADKGLNDNDSDNQALSKNLIKLLKR